MRNIQRQNKSFFEDFYRPHHSCLCFLGNRRTAGVILCGCFHHSYLYFNLEADSQANPEMGHQLWYLRLRLACATNRGLDIPWHSQIGRHDADNRNSCRLRVPFVGVRRTSVLKIWQKPYVAENSRTDTGLKPDRGKVECVSVYDTHSYVKLAYNLSPVAKVIGDVGPGTPPASFSSAT